MRDTNGFFIKETANAVQGRDVGKTFLGSRVAMQIATGRRRWRPL